MTLEMESLHQLKRKKVPIEKERKVLNRLRYIHSSQVRATYELLPLRMVSSKKLPTNLPKIPKLRKKKVKLNRLSLTV